ncbi:hypothetical protein BgiBS90_007447, partial [Biomphalaria glabrata]
CSYFDCLNLLLASYYDGLKLAVPSGRLVRVTQIARLPEVSYSTVRDILKRRTSGEEKALRTGEKK